MRLRTLKKTFKRFGPDLCINKETHEPIKSCDSLVNKETKAKLKKDPKAKCFPKYESFKPKYIGNLD